MSELYPLSIGTMHTAYYQEQFNRFETLGRTMPSWNHGAAFFTLAWLVLRKLWRPALIYAAVLLAITAIWAFALHARVPIQVEVATCLLAGLLLCAIPGWFANGWYYNHVRKQTLDSLALATSLSHARALLVQGSPDKKRLQIIVLVQAVLGLALTLWLYHQPHPDSAPRNASSAPASQRVPASASLSSATPPSPAVKDGLKPPSAMQETAAADVQSSNPPLTSTPTPPSEPIDSFSDHNKPALSTPANTFEETRTPHASTRISAATAKVAATRSEKTPPMALLPGKYYLNAGVYAQASNVERAIQRLQAAQLHVLHQTVHSKQRTLTQLRIGPFNNQQQAQQAAIKAQKLGIETSLFQHTKS